MLLQKNTLLKTSDGAYWGKDLGFIGRRFTWVNNHTSRGLIKQRLNRAFADKEWL